MRRSSDTAETIPQPLPLGLLDGKSDHSHSHSSLPASLIVSQLTPRSAKLAQQTSTGSKSNQPQYQQYKLDQPQSQPKPEDTLEYGFVPRSIIASIKDKDWRVRSDAIEKLFELVVALPNSPPTVLPHMPNLIRFLSKVLFDPNFTICLTSIRLIGELLPKLQHHIKPTLSFFLPSLFEKFGDSKIIIRQETMKVVSRTMQLVPPSTVIDVIKACYDEKSANIQQHLLIVVIKAYLSFKEHHFDYPSIIPTLLLSLNSQKTKVKQAGIEALAVVNEIMSESQSTASLLESMLLTNCDTETVKMLHRRFSRGQLPILGPDGLVEFRIGADGSVTNEFFDPALSNTPVPSPAPSRIHTPMTTSSPSTIGLGDELTDSRHNRHWSAGSKAATLAKLPPWFPSTTPSSPSATAPGSPLLSGPSTPTHDDIFAENKNEIFSGDVRRSVFQRTRSLSMSDKNDDSAMRSNPTGNSSNIQPNYNYYHNNSSSPLNLPPIGALLGPTQRTASPTFYPDSPMFSPAAPNYDTEKKRTNRPPSPTLSSYSTNRDTGYTPSFGKKGPGGMPPPTFSFPVDQDNFIPGEHPSNFGVNSHMSNIHTPIPARPTNSGSLTVTTNFEDDSLQQHRAKIWSTLKPSALATFPTGNNETPKRRFSGRSRKDPSLPEHNSFTEYSNTNSNFGILENVEDDFDFDIPLPAPKQEHPKSATRKQSASKPGPGDEDASTLQHVKSSPNSVGTAMIHQEHVGPRSASALSSAKSPKPPRSGHSRHLSRDKDAESTTTPPQAPPTSAVSGPRQVNTSPADIIPSEQLLPFDNPDLEMKQVNEWFTNGEWYHHFEALASIRTLAAHHPRLVIAQIHPILNLVLGATNNLRSLVSRHALVCIGDLFKNVGKNVEPHLDEIMVKILKKYNESNNFLEKELDRAMGLMLLNVGEARAVGVLLMSSGNKSSAVRCKVAFFLANLVDILGQRIWSMREADRVLGVVVQLIQESSAEARAQGRRALYLMHQSDPDEFERVLKRLCNESQLRKCHEVLEKIISCGDPVSLGAKKPNSAKPTRTPKSAQSSSPNTPSFAVQESEEGLLHPSKALPPGSPNVSKSKSPTQSPPTPFKDLQASPERRETPVRGRESPMREASKSANPTPINNNAAPELDGILTDLDSADWKTRYNAITALVELSTKEGKVQALLTARVVKIFDHFTPRLQDANSKVNMFALSSLKQMIPSFRNALESVLGVMIPALIANLAATKQELRTITQEVFDDVLAYADGAALIPHFTCGVTAHANPKVKVVLLQFLADISGSVYATKSYVVVKHVLPLAFKLLDEKKGELRVANTKLLQSLFKAMGNQLWDSSNSFNLSKQEQTRLHEILTS